MHGAIRLTLGRSSDGKHGNKVIYIGKRNDPAREYKIPYTIPYGKTMSRYLSSTIKEFTLNEGNKNNKV